MCRYHPSETYKVSKPSVSLDEVQSVHVIHSLVKERQYLCSPQSEKAQKSMGKHTSIIQRRVCILCHPYRPIPKLGVYLEQIAIEAFDTFAIP